MPHIKPFRIENSYSFGGDGVRKPDLIRLDALTSRNDILHTDQLVNVMSGIIRVCAVTKDLIRHFDDKPDVAQHFLPFS